MQFFRFLLTGGIAAAVNLLSRYLLDKFMSFEIAVALAYLLGMITAYTLARMFVFSNSPDGIRNEFMRFTIVNAFALVVVWCVSVGLAKVVFPFVGFKWYAEDIAHIIGVLVPAVTSFLGHKYFTFK
ncbi:GtrA family protein [Meridianimarinicoccus aquatilis]|uniref:GtrA family protein n=1 Tax=Meridianimarinicoccus aquatilis TaxID=2552766 RepID=A0A4R6B2L8_9RHOB|nr:GtrA family protein [Fluviibacterium aquatile]TDL90435.1 GtrA family protein [Fluviibacterium aquatile]